MFDTGRQAYENGDYVTAEEIFGEMLALNPRSARAYDARGTVHTTLNDFDSALDDYTKAIGVDPLYPPAYYNRGRVYGQLRRYDEALADIERAVELAPLFFGYRAYGNIGLIHHQRGEYDEALEAFAKSMSYDDGNADVYYYRGQTYTALENYDAAIADYQAAIDRFSSYADAYQGLGYAYYKSGQYDQALENLNQALTISPQSPSSRLYLALIYVTADELEIAGREVSQATDHLAELPEDERELILNRVLSELEILAQEQPDRASAIAEIIGSLPDSN